MSSSGAGRAVGTECPIFYLTPAEPDRTLARLLLHSSGSRSTFFESKAEGLVGVLCGGLSGRSGGRYVRESLLTTRSLVQSRCATLAVSFRCMKPGTQLASCRPMRK